MAPNYGISITGLVHFAISSGPHWVGTSHLLTRGREQIGYQEFNVIFGTQEDGQNAELQ
jgi:hypothetical protein